MEKKICHTYDAQASLDSAANLSSSEKAMIKEANGGSNTVDVSGGYHDAGDHIKFNVTMGFAASSLAMSYYMNPGAYEKANCEGHFREVLKKTCDYLMKQHILIIQEKYMRCAQRLLTALIMM